MSATLSHPSHDDLGGFIDGRLPANERAAVVEHVAGCDDCRMIVADTTLFNETAAPTRSTFPWPAAAAALIAVIGAGLFIDARRDPLAGIKEAYGSLKQRPVEARLSELPYKEWRVNRGGSDEKPSEPEVMKLEGAAGEVMDRGGKSAKMLHAKGIANLIIAETSSDSGADNRAEAIRLAGNRAEAITLLQAAANADPQNARYWSDLSAALITSAKYDGALAAAERALKLQPDLPDALFNRALALQALERPKEAVQAYQRYLHVDPSSGWADEAEKRLGHTDTSPSNAGQLH